jgi:Uma2 family endonuclease
MGIVASDPLTDWSKPSPRDWTRDEYHRAAEVGILRPNEKLELIEGEILSKSPIGSQHSVTVHNVFRFLSAAFSDSHYVTIHQPIALSDNSEPEPDVFIAVGKPSDYEDHHPTPAELKLVVEISDTTLSFDRTRKAALYSASKIGEYWIVNLVARQIEVYRRPDPSAPFQEAFLIKEDLVISPEYAPSVGVLVSSLLPRKRQ